MTSNTWCSTSPIIKGEDEYIHFWLLCKIKVFVRNANLHESSSRQDTCFHIKKLEELKSVHLHSILW